MNNDSRDSKEVNEHSAREQEEKRRQDHAGPVVCTVARTYPQSETVHNYEITSHPEEVESGYLY